MLNYNGYRIGSTCGKVQLYFIQALRNKKWTDLFFGIESLDKAKQLVDNWTIAVKVLG